MEETAIAQSEDPTAPTSSNSQNRKRGQRNTSKLNTKICPVTALHKDGALVQPEGVNAPWRNDCGCLVRRKINIKYDNWLDVPKDDKEELWKSLSKIYIFPPEISERAKTANLKTMGRCLRMFRTNLNRDYVQKSLTPFEKYGYITSEDW